MKGSSLFIAVDPGITIAISSLSFLACLSVIISIYMDPKSLKSYHLQLVLRLLCCDLLLSFLVIFYYIITVLTSNGTLKTLCKVYLPLVLFSFLSSYGWTIMFSLKFRRTYSQNKEIINAINLSPIPFWSVWFTSFILSLPILIIAFINNDIISIQEQNNESCTFNFNSSSTIIVALVCFESPLIITILLNLYFYSRGLLSLRTAPQSVISRKIRRAGGYIAILLIVWIPNLIYGFLNMFDNSDKTYQSLLDLSVLLVCSQGFLNVCIFFWTNKRMKKWLIKNLFIFKIFNYNELNELNDINEDEDEKKEQDDEYSNSIIIDNKNNNHDHDYSNSSKIRIDRFFTLSSVIGSNNNPLNNNINNNNNNENNSIKKGILVNRDSNNKTTKENHIDPEKFVKFGKTDVRIISIASYNSVDNDYNSMLTPLLQEEVMRHNEYNNNIIITEGTNNDDNVDNNNNNNTSNFVQNDTIVVFSNS